MKGWFAAALLGVAFGVAATLLVPRSLPSATRGASEKSNDTPKLAAATSARGAAMQASEAEMSSVRDAILRGALQAQAEAAETDPSRGARETFDRRLAEAAPNAANTASMEQALRKLIDSGVLGKTTTSFVCGATMCRLELKNPKPEETEQSVRAFAEQLPKLFSRTLALPTAPGERAIYVTTDPAALNLGSPPEHVTVMPAPSAAP